MLDLKLVISILQMKKEKTLRDINLPKGMQLVNTKAT